MIQCRHPPGIALLLELHEVVSLAGAKVEVFLSSTADNIQQHGTLGVHGRGLVGLTTENVERGLVDRALLQQGLPRYADPYLVIGGHDLVDDRDDGGQQRTVA